MSAMNRVEQQRYQRIFLLSHMRAYSSLLGHILGSHPQVNGYYEMHLSYSEATDLDRQLRIYRQSETLKPGSYYLFDKLLHNDYELDTRILSSAERRILVSIRSPGPSLKSLLHLYQGKPVDHPYAYPSEAAEYYIQRLHALSEFCRNNPGEYYYFDAELIKSESRKLLKALTDWCRLPTALSDRYQTFSLTGEAGAGDSSGLIASGRIDVEESRYPGIQLEEKHLRSAENAWSEYRGVMMEYARDSLTL